MFIRSVLVQCVNPAQQGTSTVSHQLPNFLVDPFEKQKETFDFGLVHRLEGNTHLFLWGSVTSSSLTRSQFISVSLSVCLSVCLSVSLEVTEQISRHREVADARQFLINFA